MRASWLAFGIAGAMVLASPAASAQQRPIYGCNAAPTCKPLGYSTLSRIAGESGLFFGIGMRWSPGVTLFIAAPYDITLAGKLSPSVDGDFFHLRVSLLTPAPTPPLLPPPVPPTNPAKD